MRIALAAVPLAALLACATPPPRPAAPIPLRILAVNDLHGQLEPGPELDGRTAGGAPVLAAWLRAARAGAEDRTLLVSAGDLVGGSPALSALLQDEPTIAFLGSLAGPACAPVEPARRDDLAALAGDPACDVVATVGNHELDEGLAELRRLWHGGDHAGGPFLERPWPGARFPLVSATLVARETGAPALPPFVVRERGGVPVGVVGAVTAGVRELVDPAGLAGVDVRDEAEAVNGAARALAARGVRAIVVLLHDGGEAPPYAGPTRAGAGVPAALAALVGRLDGEVDVVVSAHAHGFTNAVVPNAAGRPVLVTQAFSGGAAFARIDLAIDPATRDVVERRAEIVRAWADEGPGLAPDAAAARLVDAARARVGERLARVVTEAAEPLRRGGRPPRADETLESALGDLVADAFRAATRADVALCNGGGLRADLRAGPVTWGDLYAVLPFGNRLVTLELTGAALREVLEQQWKGQPEPRALAVSGLAYAWDPAAPAGARVRRVAVGGAPLDPARRYTVAVPAFLANGGDGFVALTGAARRAGAEPLDLDALEAWVRTLPAPLAARLDGRVARTDRE